ncbi:MAG: cytochrome C oxidase subunit IV family protein [Flavobacteriales bacterium]|nr:cytochrome C oxidase subunit IV family protein [Flavobacteriales bacterium]MBP6641827.1 cytochrome C oxidase subunit IV family protein [Flavobacteriales bacterium]MBP7155368.1 cytochrome C oxidase subunit IV family protein [Flavobacteriales bacterium]HQV74728.1 cytochrome C oxidase subunit IV family protein [Flavobacteriales bacterium]HQW41144.1 cytochrome C oxidase subunit IV family protein [Flavobacteriales bacterium]
MERDDIIEYSLDAHHSEEEGAKIRRNIWMVTLFLAVVTTIEVTLGAYWKDWFDASAWNMIKWTYVVLTLVKATYIVMSFMHLGDERKNIRMIILAPYAFFILYLLYIGLVESNYVHQMWEHFL